MRFLVVGDFQGNLSKKLREKIKKENFDSIIAVGDYTGIAEWRPYIMMCLQLSKQGLPMILANEFFGDKKFRKLLKKDEDAAKKVLRYLNSFGKPVILVFGNGDDNWYNYPFGVNKFRAKKNYRNFVKRLKNVKDITYSNFKLEEMQFVGFGGYMDIDAYFDEKVFRDEDKERIRKRLKRHKFAEKNLFNRLKKIDRQKDLVFVLHYPPKGVFDIIKDRKDNPMNGYSAGIGFFREAIVKYKPLIAFCGHMHEYQGIRKIGKTFVVNPGDAEKNKFAIVDVDFKKGKKIKVNFVR